jgi:uncharacterized protein DUF4279
MRREVTASFQITSEMTSGDELRRRSGLSTGVIHNQGDPIAQRTGSRVYSQSILRIDSTLSCDSSISEHLANLLSIIEPHAALVAGLDPECSREIWFKISHDQTQLGLEIPANDLARLAHLGTSVLFDIYSEASESGA